MTLMPNCSMETSSTNLRFLGYSWRVCVCPKCGRHLGWMYEPKDNIEEGNKNNNEKPSEMGFYGLILENLIDEKCRNMGSMIVPFAPGHN